MGNACRQLAYGRQFFLLQQLVVRLDDHLGLVFRFVKQKYDTEDDDPQENNDTGKHNVQ